MNDASDRREVAVVPRHPRSSVIFGAEIIFGPKARFDVSIGDESGEAASRLAAVDARIAEANARAVLDGVAEASARRAKQFPNSPSALCQAGFANVARGNYTDAAQAFGDALRIDPLSRTARLGMARVTSETGEPSRALEILRALQAENPSDLEITVALAVVVSEIDGVDAALNELTFEPKQDARSASFFAARGSLRVAARDYPGAIRDLRKAARAKPDWVHARNVLGIAELKSGNVRAAEQRFREAMRIGPMYVEGFLNLLRVLMFERRYGDVLESVGSRYKDVAATPARIGRIASQAAMELEQWNVAREWIESALGKADEPELRARLLNDLGVTHARMGRNEEAKRRFIESVRAHPTELAIVNCAKSMLADGDPSGAVAWLAEVPPPDGSPSSERMATLGFALADTGMHGEATKVFEGLLEMSEPDIGVFANLTVAYTDYVPNLARAIAVGREGVGRFPSNALLLNNLAYALLMANDTEGAAELLDREISAGGRELVCLTATKGLLALKRGDIEAGRVLYDKALSLAQVDALRERVRAKRDLEVARVLIREDPQSKDGILLLEKAAAAGKAARPYRDHAQEELNRLSGGGSEKGVKRLR